MIDSIQLAAQIRAKAVRMSHTAGAAHLASALSCTDIVAVLFHSVLQVDPRNPKWDDRDRFILSKGHAATALYAGSRRRLGRWAMDCLVAVAWRWRVASKVNCIGPLS